MEIRDITYSFIIPHRNSLSLLNRCLNSIPKREDVEIIVVDDNSNVGEKPLFEGEKIRGIYIDAENSKGAGRARNVGLSNARGKWIVFADADDYFVPNFLSLLDNYVNSNIDVVYYNHNLVKDEIVFECANEYINNYHDTDLETIDLVKFRINTPWNKMIKKDFIDTFRICFEECVVGNDVFFSYQVGYLSRCFAVEKSPCYNYIINTNSLTHKKRTCLKHHLCSIKHRYQGREFYKYIGHPEWKKPIYRKFLAVLIKNGIIEFLKAIYVFVVNYHQIKETRFFFVKEIKKKEM